MRKGTRIGGVELPSRLFRSLVARTSYFSRNFYLLAPLPKVFLFTNPTEQLITSTFYSFSCGNSLVIPSSTCSKIIAKWYSSTSFISKTLQSQPCSADFLILCTSKLISLLKQSAIKSIRSIAPLLDRILVQRLKPDS